MTTAISRWAERFRRKEPPAPVDVPADVPVLCIVTPVLNGATYIDDAIRSVLTQSGDFVLHYHVQDGGSTDDTLARVQRWMGLAETLPNACRRLIFTCTSEPDTGMYDAVNKGFARALPPGDDVMMGWTAADDRVAPGACATMVEIRATFPDVRFMGGRISLIDERGSILGVHQLVPFSRRCMAAGLYDGRAMSFVMQEGSFWCADLWRKVCGIDSDFRLAGDWDLWRRIAVHADYVSVDGLLGFHRRRVGQLSEQMDAYYAEIDAMLENVPTQVPDVLAADDSQIEEPLRASYLRIADEHERIRRDPSAFRQSFHSATAIRYNLGSRQWERITGLGAISDAPQLVTPAGATNGSTVILQDGFLAAEGPYPEHNLFAPVRWIIAPEAGGEVTLKEAGRFRIVLRCRSWIKHQVVTITADGEPLGSLKVTPYEHDLDLELSVEGVLDAGRHCMGIAIDQPTPAELYLLVIEWRLERLPPPFASQLE